MLLLCSAVCIYSIEVVLTNEFTGFENPAATFLESALDLGEIISHPASTFIYQNTEIDDRSPIELVKWYVIDSSLKPELIDSVLIELHGEQTIRRVSSLCYTTEPVLTLGTVTAIIKHHHITPAIPDDLQFGLHSALIPLPAAAFISRARGSKMSGLGIKNEDLLVVRRDVNYEQGSIAVIYSENKFMCRVLNLSNNTLDDADGVQSPLIRPLSAEGVATASIEFKRPVIAWG
ncbi:S24 family peptidase [Moritella sp. F3]|uniref:S24 family peptidase n=1 Tax=Moritella sp. F3 TaxID=2718882 RepID=UPI0018E163E8|nr:S24 family peptidase [Moritella sp. F3]